VPRFDVKSFATQLRAIVDIKAGDEIFWSYCSEIPDTAADRQTFLAHYGFQCTCTLCTTSIYEHLKRKLLASDQKIDKSYEAWLKDLTLPDDHVIKPSLVWMSLMEQHGLRLGMSYYRHLDVVVRSFIALGDLENSMKHGTKLVKYLVAMTGEEQLLRERSDANYYLRDRSFGTRRRTVGKGKLKRQT
jgi:hypothetical protein